MEADRGGVATGRAGPARPGVNARFFDLRSPEIGAEFVVPGECMQWPNTLRKLAVFHSYLYRPKG